MTEIAETINDSMKSLTVAATAAIEDYADVLVRGYLKEHPASVLYRLSLLEEITQTVRARAELELRDGRWDGGDPFDPAYEHRQRVAEYAEHACNCEWCLGYNGGEPDDLPF